MCVCVWGERLCLWSNTGCALDDASGDACKFVTGVDGSQNFNVIGFFRRARGLPKHAYVFGNKVAEK